MPLRPAWELPHDRDDGSACRGEDWVETEGAPAAVAAEEQDRVYGQGACVPAGLLQAAALRIPEAAGSRRTASSVEPPESY